MIYLCLICVDVFAPCACSTHRGQQGASDRPELDLQTAVSCHSVVCWKLKLDLQEQQALFVAHPHLSLQPWYLFFCHWPNYFNMILHSPIHSSYKPHSFALPHRQSKFHCVYVRPPPPSPLMLTLRSVPQVNNLLIFSINRKSGPFTA